MNVSSLDGLKFCVESGARVFGIMGLHSKVHLFDQRSAFVTSANLTSGGSVNNLKCGLFTDDSNVVAELHSYFETLKQLAPEPLSRWQIEEWKIQIELVSVTNIPAVSLPDLGASNAVPFNGSGQYFVKFFGSSSNSVPLTFSTQAEIEHTLCHYACGFSPAKKPRRINDNDVIFLARMGKSPTTLQSSVERRR